MQRGSVHTTDEYIFVWIRLYYVSMNVDVHHIRKVDFIWRVCMRTLMPEISYTFYWTPF